MTKIILTEESSILSAFTSVGIEAIKDEFKNTIDFTKNINLTDFEDKKQIKVVKDTKNGYVKTRNTVKRAFKSRRDINTKENKENIIAQEEILEVIEAEEKRLADLIEKAEIEQLKKDNSLKLIDRKEALKKYNYTTDNEILLVMKDKDFDGLLSSKKELYLEEQEEKELAEKKRKEDEEKARLEEIEKAKEEKELAEKRQEFIKYRDSLDFDHYEDKDGMRIFYKKVGEFKIK